MEIIDRIVHRNGGASRQHLIEFLNRQLRPGENYSIDKEYPSLFGEFPGGSSMVLKNETGILSHAGFVVRNFRHEENDLKLGIIGSVATASEYQGQGMASKLLERVLGELRSKGCQLALLWSAHEDFYEKFGFYRCGQETNLRFDPQKIPTPTEPATIVRMDRKKHGHKIWRLYQKHNVKVDRSLEEQQQLFSVPRSKVYVSQNEEEVLAYVALNKGADFKNYIHEWGGSVKEVQKIIIWLQRNVYRETSLTLIAPHHYEIEALKQIASLEFSGILGLMKILDKASLVATYRKYLKSQGFEVQVSKASDEIVVNGELLQVDNDRKTLEVIFGVGQKYPVPTLPFFLWGFDSI